MNSSPVSRRDVLRYAGLGLAGAALNPALEAAEATKKKSAPDAKAADAPREFEPLHRFPKMIHEYIVDSNFPGRPARWRSLGHLGIERLSLICPELSVSCPRITRSHANGSSPFQGQTKPWVESEARFLPELF